MNNLDEQWPNDEQEFLKPVSSTFSWKQCDFLFYYTQGEHVRNIKDHQYFIDTQLNDSIILNATSEIVAQIDGRLISVSCGVDIKTDGSLFNNARETHAASYYAVIMFVVEVCSMVISARFMLLLNGRARVSRLSYLMALFILAFDVCMLLYHFNFILDIPRASRPLGLLCMMLLVICFTFDLLIFTIIKTENDR